MQVACWEVEAGKILKGCVCNIGEERVWAGDGEVSGTVQVMDGRGRLDAQIPWGTRS